MTKLLLQITATLLGIAGWYGYFKFVSVVDKFPNYSPDKYDTYYSNWPELINTIDKANYFFIFLFLISVSIWTYLLVHSKVKWPYYVLVLFFGAGLMGFLIAYM